MIRAIIIDDEPKVRQGLALMIRQHCPDVVLAGEADSVASGLEAISQLQPDLVFIDIRMDDGTGFDLLQHFDPIDFHIIFITAFDEYAIRAFKFSAIDYLLKPLDLDELMAALHRVRHILESERQQRVRTLLDNLRSAQNQEKKIVLRTMERFYFVKVADILFCESDGNYTTVFLTNGMHIVVSKSLKEFDEMLSEYGFFRPHKSFLISLAHVTGFEKAEGGYILMQNEIRIPISFRKKAEFLKIVEGM